MKYTENYQVMAHDAEPKGIMRFGGYLKYMQETANHQLRDQEQSYYDLSPPDFLPAGYHRGYIVHVLR